MFGKLINKISYIFFGYFSEIISVYFKSLNKILKRTDITESTPVYISSTLFVSFISSFILEIIIIFVMIKLNIFFSLINFLITLFVSFTFSIIIFLVIYRYPFYLYETKKKELDSELSVGIKHLSILEYNNLTVLDVLKIFRKLKNNKLLTEETNKILNMVDLNKNLEGTLKFIAKNSYSKLERLFFIKLIDVENKKLKLKDVLNDFLIDLEKYKNEELEQKKNKVIFLFIINIFLFFFILVLLLFILFIPSYKLNIKTAIQFVSIIFPIIEITLIILLNK